jgi:alpha-tubulin suppressor-like RCC1 family protein
MVAMGTSTAHAGGTAVVRHMTHSRPTGVMAGRTASADPTANALGWGYNYYGYIGNGSYYDVTTPPWASPSGETYVTQISAESGVLALHADGSVTAWGRNDEGQLGDGATSYRELSPVHVILPPVVQVSSGDDEFGLALTGSGQVYSWGNDTYGSLGRSTSGSYDPNPAKVSALVGKIRSVSAGGDHALALTVGGHVWAWGWNFAGQLGDGTKMGTVYQTPFQVPALSNVVAVAADGNDSYALTRSGSVYAWGFDYGGQGHGAVQVTGLPIIKRIAAGDRHALAIDNSGNVWAWGSNQYGQVGDGGPTGWRSPVELTSLGSSIVAVSATNSSSFAIKSDGSAWSWGANYFGQLGNGNTIQQNTPVQVLAVSNVSGISSNGFATLEWSGLRSGSPPLGNGHMVVLGDSVAAGEGVNYGFYWNGAGWVRSGSSNPTWSDTTLALGGNYQQCHQSNSAYGLYFQAFKKYTVYNMACTSATVIQEAALNGGNTAGGILQQEVIGTPHPPAQLGGTCTGCDPPNTVFDNHQPSVVLMTVGADDIDFGDWIMHCYIALCGLPTEQTTLNTQIFDYTANLRAALAELNRRQGADNPGQQLRVVVTDYYNPYGSSFSSSCVDTGNGTSQPGLTPGEQTFIVNGLTSLDQGIQGEVAYAQNNFSNLNISLVDLAGLFPGGQDIMSGHTFCSADPWVYGPSIDYPHWGKLRPGYPAPMHPTPEGQMAIFKAIVQQAGL